MPTKPRGSSYFTEFMLKGQRYRATFDTYEEGERWEIEVRHAVKIGRTPPPPKNDGRVSGTKLSSFGDVVTYGLKHNWKANSDWHITVSRYAAEMKEHFGENTPMTSIRRKEIDGFIAALQAKGNQNGTVNRKMSALSSFFKTAQALDVIPTRPAWPKRLKETETKLRFVYPHEEQKIIAKAIEFDDQELADFTMFAIDTGARFSEVVSARWDWFTPNLTSWIIWKRKADNPMGMPLTARVVDMLKRRKGIGRGPFADMNYDSVRLRLQRVLAHLELEDITIHTYRHTTASRLVQRGVDLRRVQVWMGHKSIATTIRYAKLAPNDLADLATVLEAA